MANLPPADTNRGAPYIHEPDQFGANAGQIILELRQINDNHPDFPSRWLAAVPAPGDTVAVALPFHELPVAFRVVRVEPQKLRGASSYGLDPEYIVFVEEIR